MAKQGVRMIGYVGDVPTTFVKATDAAEAVQAVATLLNVDAKLVRVEDAMTAPLADVERVVAVLHAEWLVAQFSMMAQMMGGRIVRPT